MATDTLCKVTNKTAGFQKINFLIKSILHMLTWLLNHYYYYSPTCLAHCKTDHKSWFGLPYYRYIKRQFNTSSSSYQLLIKMQVVSFFNGEISCAGIIIIESPLSLSRTHVTIIKKRAIIVFSILFKTLTIISKCEFHDSIVAVNKAAIDNYQIQTLPGRRWRK